AVSFCMWAATAQAQAPSAPPRALLQIGLAERRQTEQPPQPPRELDRHESHQLPPLAAPPENVQPRIANPGPSAGPGDRSSVVPNAGLSLEQLEGMALANNPTI